MTHRTCPICKAKLPEQPRNPSHPFCSARCKLVDLGNWLGDGYVIAGGAAEGAAESLADLGDLDAETLAALLREPS